MHLRINKRMPVTSNEILCLEMREFQPTSSSRAKKVTGDLKSQLMKFSLCVCVDMLF